MRGNIFEPGDLVAFSSKWLKATQAHELGRARGEVLEVASVGRGVPLLVSVRWSDGRTTRVLHGNLVAVERMHLEAV